MKKPSFYDERIAGTAGKIAVIVLPLTQVALLLEPTSVEQVADVSFSGGVMPQKSTDFYPKLVSGLVAFDVTPGEE